ncbi:MAG: lysophospholipid acyltransferase family protein [Kiritimatiellaeota bacterium]|nr:lysophospholipid acyltransferase family protein [Kiritimatiellota bacterium]
MLDLLVKVIAHGLARLSRPASLRLGAGLGWLTGHVVRFRRRTALAALRQSLPELSKAEATAALDGMYRNLATNLVEILRAEGGEEDQGPGFFSREGEEIITAALARGRGALILMAHYGSWELLAMFAAQRGYALHIVAKKFKNVAVNRLWNRLRERYGITVIYSHNAARPVLRALRENALIGFMLDQHRPRALGVFVQFFGRPACTSSGLAVLSSQAQAPVIPVFIRRRPEGGHHIRVLPEIAPPPDREPATILRHTQRYTTILENEIRAQPSQWIWIHRRWKTQPQPGDAIATPE